jgi:uncharacterized BrkB/YihY/UPF0761 family membrane protein
MVLPIIIIIITIAFLGVIGLMIDEYILKKTCTEKDISLVMKRHRLYAIIVGILVFVIAIIYYF